MQYVSNSPADEKEILAAIGVASFDELIAKVPKSLRQFAWKVPQGLSEIALSREMERIGGLNTSVADRVCFLGGGVYDHYVPPVVNHLAHRGEFITSYTPYQGEASQGTLQSIYEFQSLICELTGMDTSNASMYDGASSLAEAVLMAVRVSGRKKILLAGTIHPEYKEVVRTYLSFLDVQIQEIAVQDGTTSWADFEKALDNDTAAVAVQHPNFLGFLEDMPKASALAHSKGALFIACVNPASLGLLAPPGEYGADIAVGEGQPLGNPLSYGGPHFGFFTVTEALLRKMPGRIAGQTVDKVGRRAFVLTLQAREQHIRREKATSNICTNHSLCALKGAIYLSLLGREGLKKWSAVNCQVAHRVYENLLKIKGVEAFAQKPFFNEFAIRIHKDPARLRVALDKHEVLGPLELVRWNKDWKDVYLVAVTEKCTETDEKRLLSAIEES